MARIELSLLGGFGAALDGAPVTGLDTDKTRALLAYLSVESARAHTRTALAGLLWPDLPEDAARRNLRNSLFKLRQALGEDDGSPGLLQITPQTVQCDPAAGLRLDVADFESLLSFCRLHRHRKPAHCSTCHKRLQQAAALYRGYFLSGFHLPDCQAFEEWHVLKREALHRAALDALVRLATYHQARGEYEPALQYAYREVELEPWREEAHRSVMRLLAVAGRRSEALAQYVACRRALRAELDAEPSAETTRLYERIKVEDPTLSARTPAPGHNLPRQLSPLIGREDEVARITEQLDSANYGLITILGPGGAGKTRLAVQIAADQAGTFEDGVCWASLAALDSAELVLSAIAQGAGLRFEAEGDPQAQLLNYLRDKEMLLALDNFEHLLGAGGSQATDLLLSILRGAPRISILVTSRERLGLAAEYLLDLSGLPLPAGDAGQRAKDEAAPTPAPLVNGDDTLLALMQFGAVQLFVERAQQAHSAFSLSEETAPGVVDICSLVGGLPLAIVLAAAWIRHYAPARIAEAIRANLDFLTSSWRDATPQHVSLRAVFNHSWALLTAEEQRLFRRLAVFRGGWEAEAAERVAGASGSALSSLADKSLLRRDPGGRFEMHEVLRQYATEKLSEAPEERESVRRIHAEYFLELALLAEPGLSGDQQGAWLEQLEREHDNLRAALLWAKEKEEAEIGLLLGGALWRFWYVRGYYSEGRERLSTLLAMPVPGVAAQPGSAPLRRARAKALNGAGVLATVHGDPKAAHALYEESLALSRELGDARGVAASLSNLAVMAHQEGASDVAWALQEESLAVRRGLGDKQGIAASLNNLGLTAQEVGDYDKARTLHEESLALRRELGDTMGIASSLGNLGLVAQEQGDVAQARQLYQQSLIARKELGDKAGMAELFANLGSLARRQGDYNAARQLYEQGLTLSRELGYRWSIASLLHDLGLIAREQGAYDQAFALHEESLGLRRELGETIGITASLIGLAAVIISRTVGALEQKPKEDPERRGQIERAATLLGAAQTLLENTPAVLHLDDRELYEQNLALARSWLDEAVFAKAWARGQAMSLAEVTHDVLQEDGSG